MISVRSRDGSKGLELGLSAGGVGRKMEEAELEEGEAYSYQDNGDSDARIDPDVALSYIDEKLQDVLGHLQKDFEGGVSAENLGAKFGGYGSFLPTVRRSPAWCHPRTPPKVQNHSLLKSPNNVLAGLCSGDGHNPIVSSVKSQSVRSGPSPSHTSLSVTKGPFSNKSVKQEEHDSYIRNEAINHKSGKKKIRSLSDHKTLKVRIKVGSDNLSTRKNAAIYSGLGLDVSPSSSLDDAPSEGMCHDLQHTAFESPASILQIMTSFPIHGGLLLSPLPVDLIHLYEKERHSNDALSLLPGSAWKGDGALGIGNEVAKRRGKFLSEKKIKPTKGNHFSSELESGTNKASQNSTMVMPKKEPEIDIAACEKLISNTLKLPLLSNLCSSSGEKTNNMGRIADTFGSNKVMVQEAVFIEREERELVVPSSGWPSSKQKNGPATKVWDNKNDSPVNEISAFSTVDGHRKDGKTLESASVNSQGKKFKNDELTNPPKKKPIEKFTPQQHDNAKGTPAVESAPPEGKNKSKRNETNSFLAENACSESLRMVESEVNNCGKVVNAADEIESEHIKSQKNLGKSKERYRDFFGDVDEEENQVDSLELPSEDRLKSSDLIGKGGVALSGSSNGRPIGALYTMDSAALEDYWVGCDKCQKWRLLPLGIYPENLPEKWICNMLDWLPGMNRCTVSEEETTKALIAQRQAAASAIVTQGNIGHVQDPVQDHPNYDLVVFSGGKKKNGAKEVTAGMVKGGSSQLSNLTKKKVQTSMKSRSLNDMNQYPLGSENDSMHLNLSNNMAREKHNKHKEKQKGLHLHSNGDVTKSSKVKSKRALDQDFSGSSKKKKRQGTDFISDDRTSDHSGAILKFSHGSRIADLNASVGKEQPRHTDQSFMDSKNESKDRQQASVGKVKDEAMASLNNGSQNIEGCESKDIIKNRKVKQSLPGKDFVEENDSRKEKKAKIFDTEGKESSGSKASSRHGRKKGTPFEHQQLGQQRSLDDADLLKRDMGYVQASVAATSSSSKISGSQKKKSRFQEVKGSPVESVSSSPMRISKQNNIQSSRNFTGKDVSEDALLFSTNSPDGDEDGGSDQSRTRRKDKPSALLRRESLDFSLPDAPEWDMGHSRGSKSRVQVIPSPDANNHRISSGLDSQGINPCPREQGGAYQYPDESKQNNTQFQANELHPSRSGKGSSSCLKDESRSNNLNYYQVKIDTQDSLNELRQSLPLAKEGQNASKKIRIRSDKTENKCVNQKVSAKLPSGEIGATLLNIEEREYLKVRVNGADYRKDDIFNSRQNQLQGSNSDRSSNRNLSDRRDQVEIDHERVMSLPLVTPGEDRPEMPIHCSRAISGLQKGNTVDILQGDALESNNVLKSQKQKKKVGHQNGAHNSRHTSPSSHRASDNRSPARRDSSNQAATKALKEAKDLKHMADRLKNSGSNHEGTGMYFEAALKFLNAASLLESCSSGSKQSEMIQSMQIYSSTAKLCEFCGIEYEKCKDMAAASLAYKCMEVAYMRVIYSSHNNANRDRNELQTALQIVPPCNYGWQGESPSSSASDVDNLNNPTTVDKATLSKGVCSPQVAGSHLITAKNRPNFVRLLNYAQDVNFAMEASRKSRIAFSAASEGGKIGDNILAIKRALDLNFHDVDELLHLVRLAVESIS